MPIKYRYSKIKEYPAHGGPSKGKMGGDGHPKGRTRAGRYVVHTIEKHISYSRYPLSSVAWGTPLRAIDGKEKIKKKDKNGKEIIVEINAKYVQIEQKGIGWVNLSSTDKRWKRDTENVLFYELRDYYKNLYRKDAIGDLPPVWLFNDFGHISVKYFKDLNNNYRLDKKEKVMGDFIHTTPNDEAYTARGKKFDLVESHGCIHVKPRDIDEMIDLYIKRGSIIEVYPYEETVYSIGFERSVGKPGYETHFFPGVLRAKEVGHGELSGVIIIYKVDKIT